MPTYYEILGVSQRATKEEIKQARREKIKEAKSNTDIAQIELAYQILSDKNKRKLYNFNLAEQEKAICSNDDNDGSFFKAICDNQVSQVNSLLTSNPGLVKIKSKAGETPLEIALRSGNVGLVRLLLEKGADANEPLSKACYGWRPLRVLINLNFKNEEARVEIIKLLMHHGADVNYQYKKADSHPSCLYKDNGETVLHIAIRSRSTAVAKALLASGANVNIANDEGETPLDYMPKKGIYTDSKGRLVQPPEMEELYWLLKLKKYQEDRPNQPTYSKAIRFFKTILFARPVKIMGEERNLSRKEKMDSANNLSKVVLQGESNATLFNTINGKTTLQRALANGKLGKIYSNLTRSQEKVELLRKGQTDDSKNSASGPTTPNGSGIRRNIPR